MATSAPIALTNSTIIDNLDHITSNRVTLDRSHYQRFIASYLEQCGRKFNKRADERRLDTCDRREYLMRWAQSHLDTPAPMDYTKEASKLANGQYIYNCWIEDFAYYVVDGLIGAQAIKVEKDIFGHSLYLKSLANSDFARYFTFSTNNVQPHAMGFQVVGEEGAKNWRKLRKQLSKAGVSETTLDRLNGYLAKAIEYWQGETAYGTVRVSILPHDLLSLGCLSVDKGSCYHYNASASPFAPYNISLMDNSVCYFVYDHSDKLIGRAWGYLDHNVAIATNHYGGNKVRIQRMIELARGAWGYSVKSAAYSFDSASDGAYLNGDDTCYRKEHVAECDQPIVYIESSPYNPAGPSCSCEDCGAHIADEENEGHYIDGHGTVCDDCIENYVMLDDGEMCHESQATYVDRDGTWYLSEDCVKTWDDEYAHEDNAVKLYNGEWAHEDDDYLTRDIYGEYFISDH